MFQIADASNAMQDGRLRQAQLKMLSILKVVDQICQKHHLDYWLEGGTLLGAVRHQGFIPWDDDLDISMTRDSINQFIDIAKKELPSHLFLQSAHTDKNYFNLAAPYKIRDNNSRFIEFHENGDQPFHQGIFIDIFVYDKLPVKINEMRQWQLLSKKLLRLLRPKYTSLNLGHNATLYNLISRCLSKSWLEQQLNQLLAKSAQLESPWLGYGFDCVNNNRVHYNDIFPLKRIQFEDSLYQVANRYETILEQLYGNYMQLPAEKDRNMQHCKELIIDLEAFQQQLANATLSETEAN
jgi:lipopolysaccharide cholinephosphotransferase